jgi:hypothetical protein
MPRFWLLDEPLGRDPFKVLGERPEEDHHHPGRQRAFDELLPELVREERVVQAGEGGDGREEDGGEEGDGPDGEDVEGKLEDAGDGADEGVARVGGQGLAERDGQGREEGQAGEEAGEPEGVCVWLVKCVCG